MEAACAHTKIKEITWYNYPSMDRDRTQSSKFMCLDCNTDFIPVTPEIRQFLFRKQFGYEEKGESPFDTSWAETKDIRKDNYNEVLESRRASREKHGVDCTCKNC